MLFKKQKALKIIGILALLSSPFFVQAHGLVPCGGYGENPCNILDIFYEVARVTNWLMWAAGIYAFYHIISGGFWLVVTMGNEEAITKRKNEIQQAVIGMVLVMLAYVFVNTTVNVIMRSKCKINLTTPWTYITPTDPNGTSCATNPYNKDLTPSSTTGK